MECPRFESQHSSTISAERVIRRVLGSITGGDLVKPSAILRAAEAGNAKRLVLEAQGQKNEIKAMHQSLTPEMRKALEATTHVVPSSGAPMPIASSFMKSNGSVVGPDSIHPHTLKRRT